LSKFAESIDQKSLEFISISIYIYTLGTLAINLSIEHKNNDHKVSALEVRTKYGSNTFMII
jgi:hypothetical protein